MNKEQIIAAETKAVETFENLRDVMLIESHKIIIAEMDCTQLYTHYITNCIDSRREVIRLLKLDTEEALNQARLLSAITSEANVAYSMLFAAKIIQIESNKQATPEFLN